MEVTQGNFMYPAEVSEDSEVAMALATAREMAGETGPPLWFPAALDAGYLNEKGIETVMFGPGDLAFAHTDAEVVPVEQVRRAARVYAAVALHILV